ncbi:hypothetical protein ACVWY2_001612 [Bradyrhizobium sp. JR6.1]
MQSDIPLDTVWSILEAANELGDTHTVDACRRIIDANLRARRPGTIRPQRGRRILCLIKAAGCGL